jgi:hypothetical protein
VESDLYVNVPYSGALWMDGVRGISQAAINWPYRPDANRFMNYRETKIGVEPPLRGQFARPPFIRTDDFPVTADPSLIQLSDKAGRLTPARLQLESIPKVSPRL